MYVISSPWDSFVADDEATARAMFKAWYHVYFPVWETDTEEQNEIIDEYFNDGACYIDALSGELSVSIVHDIEDFDNFLKILIEEEKLAEGD